MTVGLEAESNRNLYLAIQTDPVSTDKSIFIVSFNIIINVNCDEVLGYNKSVLNLSHSKQSLNNPTTVLTF